VYHATDEEAAGVLAADVVFSGTDGGADIVGVDPANGSLEGFTCRTGATKR
jgi:hypothetical protein